MSGEPPIVLASDYAKVCDERDQLRERVAELEHALSAEKTAHRVNVEGLQTLSASLTEALEKIAEACESADRRDWLVDARKVLKVCRTALESQSQ